VNWILSGFSRAGEAFNCTAAPGSHLRPCGEYQKSAGSKPFRPPCSDWHWDWMVSWPTRGDSGDLFTGDWTPL